MKEINSFQKQTQIWQIFRKEPKFTMINMLKALMKKVDNMRNQRRDSSCVMDTIRKNQDTGGEISFRQE